MVISIDLGATHGDIAHPQVASVAAEVGYESEAAFSRAFKKMIGVPPSAWRRRAGPGLSRSIS